MHCWLLRVSRLIASQRRRAGAGREPSAAVLEKASTSEQPVRGESCDEVCSELIMSTGTLQSCNYRQEPPSRGRSWAGAALSRCKSRAAAAHSIRSASRRLLPRLEAVAAPPLHAVAGAAPAGVRPAAARPLKVAAAGAGQQPHGRTTPIQNLKTPAFAAISIFWHAFCSAEKWLTTRTRTCRGRAPETSTYHRTRKVAPLLCGRFLADNPKNRSRLAVHDFAY
jgi:hypothetical protein